MAKKYCYECGSPFEVTASTSSRTKCGDCDKQKTQQPIVKQQNISFQKASQKQPTNQYKEQLVNKFNFSPEEDIVDQPEEVFDFSEKKQDILKSFSRDLQKSAQASKYSSPQILKAEDVIASNPNPNHTRTRRQSSNLQGLSAEQILKNVGERKNIDI